MALQGAEWSAEVDLSNCETGLSQVSQQLCEIALVNAHWSRIIVRKSGACLGMPRGVLRVLEYPHWSKCHSTGIRISLLRVTC